MRKLLLLASVAAMAGATPLIAQGHGGHGGHGGGPRGGPPHNEARGDHGPNQAHGKAQPRPQQREQRAVRIEQGRGHGNPDVRHVEREVRQLGHGRSEDVREARREERRDWGGWLDGRGAGRHGGEARERDRFSFLRDGRPLPVRVAQGGCPPGLAKQNAFCLPPGQLRRGQLIGQRIDRNRFGAVPHDWLYRFRDDDDFYYRADPDGFVYRVDRRSDLVSAIFPLLSTRLGIGEPLPLGYEVYNVPFAYRDDFVDSDDWLYRYDDNAIYRANPRTGLIDSVVALLTGSPISVGSQLPAGYDAYNLPTDYRDRYADDQDSLYRYADGGIYEVDPTTMLVRALAEMIG
jgi:hypothetical protein